MNGWWTFGKIWNPASGLPSPRLKALQFLSTGAEIARNFYSGNRGGECGTRRRILLNLESRELNRNLQTHWLPTVHPSPEKYRTNAFRSRYSRHALEVAEKSRPHYQILPYCPKQPTVILNFPPLISLF